MSEYRSKLDNLKFHYWIKTGLALMYTKEGLRTTISEVIEYFQQKAFSDILNSLNLPRNTSCKECSTEQIVCTTVFNVCKQRKCSSVHKPCPENGLCERFRDKIRQAHRYNDPSWKNTDAKHWYDDYWQIAKCFMPIEGYMNKRSFMETDFNGVISVILNYKGFQNIIKEDLSQGGNLFSKARDISNKFRHSPTFEVNEDEFEECINILEKLLTDPKHLASLESTKAAMDKITKLRKDEWAITPTHDLVSVLNEELHYDENDVNIRTDARRTDKRSVLRRSIDIMSNKPVDAEDAMFQLSESFDQFRQKLKQEFVERLVIAYQDQCSTLPISALVKEEDAQLLQFFVKPTLKQVDHHNIKSRMTNIRSYKDIFFKLGQPCTNIYVTGDAGIGKTAFCQRMVLTWCHAKSGGMEDQNFSAEDIGIIKQFSFLFYVILRETKLCQVKEMIQKQLYTLGDADLIEQILDKEICLIILDGLDEWTHQTVHATCPINQKFPHRLPSKNCTYLTTTRPWKLEGNRLKTNEIDQQVELRGLDKQSCRELAVSVINHLNNKLDTSRNPRDFQREVALNRLDNVCEVPIVLMQLICLWFDERTLGTSRCSIYAETIEMLFKRASEDVDIYDSSVYQTTEQNLQDFHSTLPDCLRLLQAVSKHVSLLYKVGHLAFEGLFGKPDEDSELIFDSSVGRIYSLSETEMSYLLSVGLLSKNKVVGTLSKRRLKLSFLHKSYQEFLAAVFIAMQEKIDNSIENRIFTKCKTLRIFLRFENMFLFLSGMCPKVLLKFSAKIKAIFGSDKQIRAYRKYADYKFGFVVMLPPFSILTDPKFVDVRDAERLLQTYQTLALQCQEESQRAGNNSIVLPLEDVFLPETCSNDLHLLLVSHTKTIKSISTEKYYDDLLEVKNVEKFSINSKEDVCPHSLDIEKYENCMNLSLQSLECLSVSNYQGMFDMCKLQFPNLKSIDLYNIILKHQQISDLFTFISKKTDLVQILLFQIKCFEHKEECSGGKLNLLDHKELDFLRLQNIYKYGHHETRVNCSNLGTFIFEDSTRAAYKTSAMLLDLKNAPRLFEVTLLGISCAETLKTLTEVIPSLKHLKRLSLYNCEFGDNYVKLDAVSQKEIERICFLNSTFTIAAFSSFVDSIPVGTDNVVSVHMQSCKFLIGNKETSVQEGVEATRNYILSKPRFNPIIWEPFHFYFESVVSNK